MNFVVVSSKLADRWGERSLPTLDWIAIVAAIVLAIASTWMLARRRPGFLRAPGGVGWLGLGKRLVGALAVSTVSVAILAAALEAIALATWGDRTNPQYGVSIVMGALWYSVMLAPLVAVIVAWWWERRRSCAIPADRE